MKLTGSQRVEAPKQRVWEALNDPEILRRAIPGCQSLEKEGDDRFKATVAIKIGPMDARFAGAVTLSDLKPPNSYTISGEGQGGAAGFAKGAAQVSLAEDGSATILNYDVDVTVGGRLAQLGGPIIDATAKQLTGQFFKRFGEIVAPPPAAAEAPKAAVAASSGAPVAAGTTAASTPTSGAFPAAWVLGIAFAFLAGYLAAGAPLSDAWPAISIGLLIIIAAALGFEYGRRNGATIINVDPAALKRLLGGGE